MFDADEINGILSSEIKVTVSNEGKGRLTTLLPPGMTKKELDEIHPKEPPTKKSHLI